MKKKIALALTAIMMFASAVPMTLAADDLIAADSEWDIAYSAGEANTIQSGYREQEVATVTMEEKTVGSWWTSAGTVFTLTDSNGDKLDGVKFSAVGIKAANFKEGPAEYIYNDEAHKTAKGYSSDTDKAFFNEDGNELTLSEIVIEAKTAGKIELAFELSADLSFEGDVYVSASLQGITYDADSYIENGGIVKVATVKPTVKVATKPVVGIIWTTQKMPVADIIISELDADNVLKKDKNIDLFIGQYGDGTPADIKLLPLGNSNLNISGEMKVSIANKADLSTLTVDRESEAAPSVITLTGVEANVGNFVSYGVYELYVSGDALRNNGKAEFTNEGLINVNGVTALKDRRDYFDNPGIIIEDYVIVDTVNTEPSSTAQVTIFNDGTDRVIIDSAVLNMGAPTVNVNGSLYVPLRFIAYALGAQERDIDWDGTAKTASVSLNGRMITWTQDSPVYTINNGNKATMNNDAIACIIGDRLYIPFRGFGEAFDMEVYWDAEAQSATYNP